MVTYSTNLLPFYDLRPSVQPQFLYIDSLLCKCGRSVIEFLTSEIQGFCNEMFCSLFSKKNIILSSENLSS